MDFALILKLISSIPQISRVVSAGGPVIKAFEQHAGEVLPALKDLADKLLPGVENAVEQIGHALVNAHLRRMTLDEEKAWMDRASEQTGGASG